MNTQQPPQSEIPDEPVVLTQPRKWTGTGREIEVVLLVALRHGVIAGSSAMRIEGGAGGEYYFESTFVTEGYRGQGIARLLLRRGMELAVEGRAKRVWVTVHRSNRFYIRMFMRAGFQLQSKDEVRDMVRLAKLL